MASSPNPTVDMNQDSSSSELFSLDAPTSGAYTITKYPFDLGVAEDNLHYVVFYINLPISSKYNKTENQVPNVGSVSGSNFDFMQSGGGRGNSAVNMTQAGGAMLTNGVTKFVSGLVGGGGVRAAGADALTGAATSGAAAAITAAAIDLRPKLQRIKECIALYMPDDITTTYNHGYNTVSVTAALGQLGADAALAAGALNNAKALFGGGKTATGAEQAAAMAEKTGMIGPGFKELALRSAGAAINPQNEMVFEGTNFRDFSFNFRFQARSRKEAQDIQTIIKRFRMYAAPEMMSDTQNGRYFIPPGQFDIKFYFKNKENPNIFKISTCVLKNVTPNYSGSGEFLTFKDGTPIDISLRLDFTETDIMYRELIEKFGY